MLILLHKLAMQRFHVNVIVCIKVLGSCLTNFSILVILEELSRLYSKLLSLSLYRVCLSTKTIENKNIRGFFYCRHMLYIGRLKELATLTIASRIIWLWKLTFVFKTIGAKLGISIDRFETFFEVWKLAKYRVHWC